MLSTLIKKWRGKRPSIFILSGAGLSVESGIPPYRGTGSDANNNGQSLSKGYMRSVPEKVFDESNRKIRDFDACKPNQAHFAIARFIKTYRLKADIIHITQNIDSLCEEAGDTAVFHLHGSLSQSRCQKCGATFPRKGFYKMGNQCPKCKAKFSAVRPDVVLFGEAPHGLGWILPYLEEVDIFIAVGTSGTVYPAADFVKIATSAGTPIRIFVNKEEPIAYEFSFPMLEEKNHSFNVVRLGDATETLPMVLKEVGKLIDKIP